jgi:transcriptional regulator with XRE-family HTH domain
MNETSKLGTLLRRLRREKKLTQGQIAEASGLSRVQIAYLETGKRGGGRAAWETITGLARAFGVSAEVFVKMIEDEEPVESNEPRRAGRPPKAAPADVKAAKSKRPKKGGT